MKEKIFQDLKEAMRAQDVARRTTLRMVVAAIKNLEIETSSELEDGDVLQIIQKQVKSRRESIEEFRKGNREDLIARNKLRLISSKNIYQKKQMQKIFDPQQRKLLPQ